MIGEISTGHRPGRRPRRHRLGCGSLRAGRRSRSYKRNAKENSSSFVTPKIQVRCSTQSVSSAYRSHPCEKRGQAYLGLAMFGFDKMASVRLYESEEAFAFDLEQPGSVGKADVIRDCFALFAIMEICSCTFPYELNPLYFNNYFPCRPTVHFHLGYRPLCRTSKRLCPVAVSSSSSAAEEILRNR